MDKRLKLLKQAKLRYLEETLQLQQKNNASQREILQTHKDIRKLKTELRHTG